MAARADATPPAGGSLSTPRLLTRKLECDNANVIGGTPIRAVEAW